MNDNDLTDAIRAADRHLKGAVAADALEVVATLRTLRGQLERFGFAGFGGWDDLTVYDWCLKLGGLERMVTAALHRKDGRGLRRVYHLIRKTLTPLTGLLPERRPESLEC